MLTFRKTMHFLNIFNRNPIIARMSLVTSFAFLLFGALVFTHPEMLTRAEKIFLTIMCINGLTIIVDPTTWRSAGGRKV